MKSIQLKWYMLASILISSFATFAQTGPTEDTPEEPDTGVPINSKLIWLAVSGISFAIYYYTKNKKAVCK